MSSVPGHTGQTPRREPERDRYADVGKATRASIDALLADPSAKLNRQARAHLAVLYFTASYSRLTDRVYVAQLAAVARIRGDTRNRHLSRALHQLHDLGVIVWTPTKGGQRKHSWVSLPQPDQSRPLLAVVRDEEPRPDRSPNPGQIEHGTPATPGRTPEKVFREDSAEDDDGRPSAVAVTADVSHADEEHDQLPAEIADVVREHIGLLYRSQRRLVREAYQEDPDGVEMVLVECYDAGNPAGAFMALLKDGAHRGAAGPRSPRANPATAASGCTHGRCRGQSRCLYE